MELELRYLAPYLPYQLGIKILNHKCDYVGIEYSCVDGFYFVGEMLHLTYRGGSTGKDISTVKPILRSMSDLSQEQLVEIVFSFFRNTRSIRPKYPSVKYDNGFITFYDLDTRQTYVAVKPGAEGFPVMNMSNSFDDYSIFFKLHVDMFGLIPAGLAIDINTLNLENDENTV